MTPTTLIKMSPEPGTVIHPVYSYTEEQLQKIEDLKKYSASVALPPSDPYYKWEQRWLARADTHPRYMRATKWNYRDSEKRIKATMEWRRTFKPDLIRPDDVRIEAETGKIILNGFDKDGRPIIYMRPGRENTERSDRQLRHLVWWLERAKDLQPAGQESIVILVDYKSTTLRTNPSISVAGKVLHILQDHYPETLGRALGISPFLDPVTRDKMRFNPNLLDLIDKDQLDSDFGGSYEFEFEPNSYWDQIVELCDIAPDGTRIEKEDSTEADLANSVQAMNLETSSEKAPSLCSDDSTTDSDSGPYTPKTGGSVKNMGVGNQKAVSVESTAREVSSA
ncbi:CRAL/TRIO domain-containing protein [Coprinellus micaceus]|uniref:CRAL/TRIO domain-containing protein n=1 Tax=Coprinellus micaceus TaxID=71717 RepID=A0A4Y7TFN5_COPMI|nr:CRAL/TRIO domain-containing protein [Coprinellus micaceus]